MIPAHTLSCVLALAVCSIAQGGQETPHRIEWQRSLADALAVQKATGLPLLIAVNMNGEIFNDRFRTSTYKSPEFVESTRGYVCVVASPDRHNDRDYDSLGNRIECPAFPGCTCGEHIAIEPLLFERYFDGRRNAPRHVGVSPDGAILFDRYLDRSMQTAIDAIAKHRGTPVDYAVPDSEELFERRDAASRRALEDVFRENTAPITRSYLLGMAGLSKIEPFDMLRIALHADDDSNWEEACNALAATATPAALADLEHALAKNDRPAIARKLLAAVERLGATDRRAARLHAHLTGEDDTISRAWRRSWQEPAYEVWRREPVEAELDALEKHLREKPHDHEARLRLAIARLAFAKILIGTNGSGIEFWLEDARNAAVRIPDAELRPEAHAVETITTFLAGDLDDARKAMAEALAATGGDRLPNAWLATQLFETVLQLDSRSAYARASDPAATLQPEVARADAALRLLTENRWVTEAPLLTGIGLLEYAGVRAAAREHLFAAVRRFRGSPAVHERWRARVLADLGTEQMRGIAGVLAAEAEDQATGQWFAGYAAIVAAEQHVRDGRTELSVTAYTDSVERFGKSVELNAGYANSANHFAVLALAGRALARHELGDCAAAVEDLARAADLRPASLVEKDGLGRTPRDIARRLEAALKADGNTELAAALGDIAN